MKRVLIIAYYFPPAGGSAVQRILGMARHLPAYGWHPVVLTADPDRASYPTTDPDLLRAVPADVEVVRVGGGEPYSAYRRVTGREASVGFADGRSPGWRERLARWVRANLFIPDARALWARRAGSVAERLVRDRSFDAVLTSGPPHSVHLAGRRAVLRTGTPLIVDFRDAWPDPTYQHHLPAMRWARSRDERLRAGVLDSAAAVVAVSGPMADELRTLTRAPLHVVENGFEEADFVDPRPVAHEGFLILHAGNMPAERNPTALWRALASLRAQGLCPDARVRLMGTTDASILHAVRTHGLETVVRIDASRPHVEAVDHMASAETLLLSVNRVPGAEGIVTGKVYEYVASGRPVIGLGPPGGDADRVLRTSGAGALFDHEDVDGVRAHIRTLYDAWESGRQVRGADPEQAARFSRRARAGELAEVLEAATRPDTPH